MKDRCTIVMVTPGLSDPGGIASVVSAYLGSDLAKRWQLRVVETVRGQGFLRHLRGWSGVLRACFVVGAERHCVVHVHMSSGGSFWRKACVLSWSRMLDRRCILHLHGSRFHTWALSGGAFRRSAVRRVFAMPDEVVVLSESWARRVSEFSGRQEAVVLPNPATVPEAVSVGRMDGPVLFLGRLGERKGVYDLIEAVRALQVEGIDAEWVVAGDGDVEAVSALVAGLPAPDRVTVPGWIGRDETTALLARASVFVLPSTDEGVPMALLESMANGLACVVTPVGGMPEVVVDGENGVLVEPRDADALADGLRSVLLDPRRRIRLGDKARETIISRYAVDKVAGELGLLYSSLGCPASEGGE